MPAHRTILWTFCLLLGFSPQAAAECIPGSQLVNNEKDPTRVAVGRESVRYGSPDLREMRLARRPDYQDTQIYMLAESEEFIFGVAPLVFSSWCYDTEKNSIRFLESPLRAVPLFSEDPVPVPLGSPLWVGYHSGEEKNSDCIQGIYLNYLPGGSNGHTFGRQYFAYDSFQKDVPLILVPRMENQMILYSQMWVYGYDWCYAPKENRIRFLRNPLRLYRTGGLPGWEAAKGTILWAGYTPINETAATSQEMKFPKHLGPDGKLILRLTKPLPSLSRLDGVPTGTPFPGELP